MTSKAGTEKPKRKKKSDAPSGSPQLGWDDWAKLEFPKPASRPQAEATSTDNPSNAAKTEVVDEMKTVEVKAVVSPIVETPTVEKAVEPTILSVTALNKLIRRKLEGDFQVVWLSGEISNFKSHPSGHFYFSLKDKDAQISAVMFRGFNSLLKFKPEDGMAVVVRGKITVYEPRGNYQIVCESMEPVGAGALQKAFEQLKRKLQGEGLFDQARKRPIPHAPKHIAIVTSPSGAAIRDMLTVLRRRYRAARVTVVPCSVQGVRATSEIVKAMGLANQLRDVDVIIVGRGGGSIEDMWSFNEEAVARAIVASRVPVISAVGHEVDFTIADFVADLRAPTPSAAAELVAKNTDEMLTTIRRLERGLASTFLSTLRMWSDQVRTSQRLLIDPRRRIEDAILRCDDLVERLERSIFESIDRAHVEIEMAEERLTTRFRRKLEIVRARFGKVIALLDSLSPLKVLDRGFAIAMKDGKTLTEAEAVHPGDRVTIRLAKGEVETEVKSVRAEWNITSSSGKKS